MSENPADRAALRRAFGVYPTGVTVVTTVTEDGTPVGFTANSFTSVSLDPPLLLVCPARTLGCFPAFAACARFAINVLADHQREAAETFARHRGDRFAQVAWHRDTTDLPILTGSAAHFSCAVHDRYPAGDHVILLGRVESWSQTEDSRGLAYVSGNYCGLNTPDKASSVAR